MEEKVWEQERQDGLTGFSTDELRAELIRRGYRLSEPDVLRGGGAAWNQA